VIRQLETRNVIDWSFVVAVLHVISESVMFSLKKNNIVIVVVKLNPHS